MSNIDVLKRCIFTATNLFLIPVAAPSSLMRLIFHPEVAKSVCQAHANHCNNASMLCWARNSIASKKMPYLRNASRKGQVVVAHFAISLALFLTQPLR
jgi:hypothetical protein